MARALDGGAEDCQLSAARGRAAVLLAALVVLRQVPAAPQAPAARVVRVVPIYLIPRDLDFDARRLRLNIQAVGDVRAWYARALAGFTFDADPLIVHHSRHTTAEFWGDTADVWWDLLSGEFADLGLRWRDTLTRRGADFKLLILAQGAGAWAGADSENGGIEQAADAGRVDRGDYGGLVVIGDSSLGGILAGVCPVDGVQHGTAWWCNWDTYRGTIAHELGHTWGIPHPAGLRLASDSTPPWDCARDGNTVMQCHWGFPHDSLLSYERRHLRSLRFFRRGVEPSYRLLSEWLPDSVVGDVQVRRPGILDAPSGALAWVAHGDGKAATGFPWSVVVPEGTAAHWALPPGCATLVADVGVEQGAGGRGVAEVATSGVAVATVVVAAGQLKELAAQVCGAATLTLRARGERRFRVVFGNARLYPRAAGQSGGR